MCGRFTLRTPLTKLVQQLGLFDDLEIPTRFNIAPTQNILAVRNVPDQAGRELVSLRWGLVPYWAKDSSIGNRMTNARSETVTEKPSFKHAFKRRRCLIPADGYYEWKKTNDGKQPYYIRRVGDEPFLMAGLWESWKKGEKPLETCTILTTSPNQLTMSIHDRMPVIVAVAESEKWLDPKSSEEVLLDMLVPFESAPMLADPVSKYVNNARNDSPECILTL